MSLTTIEHAVAIYLQDCTARGQSVRTIEGKSGTLNQFLAHCLIHQLNHIELITLATLRDYQQFLVDYRKVCNKPLDVTTRRNKLVIVRTFCRRLYTLEYLAQDPSERFEVPKRPRRLPSGILTESELIAIAQQTSLHGSIGTRDKCIMELYYASAMRRAELSNMRLQDVDISKNLVRVNNGKGQKDRIVPIASRTSNMLIEYVDNVRKKQASFHSGQWLFLNNQNKQFTPKQLSSLVRKYVMRAGIDRKGACNLFRHTAATQMLENGADIRVIQEQLGHADLSTTQIYTKVSNKLLIDTYHKTHPAALEELP